MAKAVEGVIAVNADGELVMWHNGAVHSKNRALQQEVEFIAELHQPVELVWGVEPVAADLSDPENHLGIFAALMGSRPGRCVPLQITPQIQAWFESIPSEEGVVY